MIYLKNQELRWILQKFVSTYDVVKRSVGYTLYLDKGKPGESQRRKAIGATVFILLGQPATERTG